MMIATTKFLNHHYFIFLKWPTAPGEIFPPVLVRKKLNLLARKLFFASNLRRYVLALCSLHPMIANDTFINEFAHYEASNILNLD